MILIFIVVLNICNNAISLNEMIKKKNEEQSQLLGEIHQIRKNPKETATELLKSSVFHERNINFLYYIYFQWN